MEIDKFNGVIKAMACNQSRDQKIKCQYYTLFAFKILRVLVLVSFVTLVLFCFANRIDGVAPNKDIVIGTWVATLVLMVVCPWGQKKSLQGRKQILLWSIGE